MSQKRRCAGRREGVLGGGGDAEERIVRVGGMGRGVINLRGRGERIVLFDLLVRHQNVGQRGKGEVKSRRAL